MKDLVYGFHSINPLIWQKPELIEIIYLDKNRKDKRLVELVQLATANNIPIEYASNFNLGNICSSQKHQGVVAKLNINAISEPVDLKSFLAETLNKPHSMIVVLDGITDPHNLGAIIRTCDCFGVDAIILPKDNSASINSTVAKVSSGAINYIPLITVNNLSRALEEIKQYGYWIVGASLTAESINLFDFNPDMKTVWVLGSEGNGIRRLVAENCDYIVNIPMYGNTQSLNVSVAAGIVLSHSRFKLRKD